MRRITKRDNASDTVLTNLHISLAFVNMKKRRAHDDIFASIGDRLRQEAIAVYWQARHHWPHEERFSDMAELFL